MKPGVLLLVYLIVSAVLALATAPFAVRALRRLKAGQTVLGYVTQHEHKSGTPTMGGIIFLLPAAIVCAVETTAFSLVALAVTLGFAVLGFLDDFIKIKFRRNLGLKPYQKIIGQLGISAIAAYFCYASPEIGTSLFLPFGGGWGDVSWWIIPFVMLVYIATTNSVNLTDGLDGLAATTSVLPRRRPRAISSHLRYSRISPFRTRFPQGTERRRSSFFRSPHSVCPCSADCWDTSCSTPTPLP